MVRTRMASSYRFIQKLWILNTTVLNKIKENHPKDIDDEFKKTTNIFVNDVTNNLSKFTYNKIIANFYEIHSSILKLIKKNIPLNYHR